MLLFVSTVLCAQSQKTRDEKAIQKCFDSYKAAIMEGNAEAAARLVDSRTISYYSEVLNVALHTDSIGIDTLSLFDKMMVLSVRHRIPQQALRAADGKALFIEAVRNGMVSKSGISSMDIGTIEISGAAALCDIISNGKRTPFQFQFYKEKDVWKINLTSLFPLAAIGFEQAAKKSNVPDNVFVFNTLEQLTGTRPTSSIWQPLRRR